MKPMNSISGMFPLMNGGALNKHLVILPICAVILNGCLIPERFTSKIDVHSDSSYTFQYSGSAVHALAAAYIKKNGPLPEKDENGFKKEAEKISKNPDFKGVIYKGNGRYQLEIEAKREAGQPLKILDIFTVSTSSDGVMNIASKEINEKAKREFNQLGITINGTLEVGLPRNVEIISHNATSVPTFFGLIGTYAWKIGAVDQRPSMKLRFKK